MIGRPFVRCLFPQPDKEALPVLTPEQALEKYKRNLGNSGEDYANGVMAVTESPGKSAAREISNYERGVLDALRSGKTKAAFEAIQLGPWQERTSTVGAQRLVEAASNPQVEANTLAAMQRWFPEAQRIRAAVRGMPKGGLANAKARSARAIEMAMAFGKNRRA